MANLKIAFPDIPLAAITRTSSLTQDEDFPVENLERGPRYQLFKTSATSTGLTITYDLGSASTGAANYFILARADRLQDESVTQVTLDRSPDNSSWTTERTYSSFGSQTLYGPREHDLVESFTATSAYRYWRIDYDASGATDYPHSKAYFGSWFEFNSEVDSYEIKRIIPDTRPFYSSDSSAYLARMLEPVYEVRLTWSGVTDAKRTEFIEAVQDKRKAQCFLYTSAVTSILDDVTLLHCEPVEFSYEIIKTDYNIVSCRFRELIG